MARPTLDPILAETASWDADVNDNNDKLTLAPIPLVLETSLANLQANFNALQYDACMAFVWSGTPGDPVNLYTSNGTDWEAPEVGVSGEALAWDYDSGWVAEANPLNISHNLGTVDIEVQIQMRDGNSLAIIQTPWQSYREDVNGEWGFYLHNNNVNVVSLQKLPTGWLTPYETPTGWAGPQPTQIRVLVREV